MDAVSGTVTTHTSQISTLRTDLNGISATVETDHTTLGTHTTQIGSLQVATSSISQDVSNISDEVDAVSGTVTTHTSQISTLRTDLNGISATVETDHTTLGTHTTQIGSLQVATSSISGRVTAIEGDYVKEAEISLMVKYDPNTGYISNANIKADNIDFTFTRATNFISGGQTVMNINSSGDLWILGEYKGGNLTGAMNVGAINAQRKFIITPSDTSGRATISGYDGNNEVIKLGWTYSDPHPVLTMDNDPSILLYNSDHSRNGSLSPTGFTASYNSYIFDIGIGNGLANIILYNRLRFPTLSEAGTILASSSYITGVVYMDNDHFLKVRDANG